MKKAKTHHKHRASQHSTVHEIKYGLTLSELFDWGTKDKYIELKQFKMEITNIFLTKHYEINDLEKGSIIRNWFDREDCQFLQKLANQNKSHAKQRSFLNTKQKVQDKR